MSAIVDLVRVLYAPVEVFQRAEQRGNLLAPLLALAAALFIVGILRVPFDRAATEAMMARLRPDTVPTGPEASSYVVVALLRATLGLVAYVTFAAVVLWFALVLSVSRPSLKMLFIVATYASAVRVVLALTVLLALVLRGTGNITSGADLAPSFGLDLLLPEGAPVGRGLRTALSDLSVFSVWSACLVGVGAKTTHRLRRLWIPVGAALVLGLPFLYHILVGSHLSGGLPDIMQRVEQ